MKKIIATIVMAVAMCSLTFAQDNNQGPRGNRPDPAQMAQRRTEMMAERYGLDDSQKASLLKLNTEYAAKMPMRPMRPMPPRRDSANVQRQRPSDAQRQRPSREEMEKRFQEMRANQEAYDAEVKKIMTDEQYKKFTEDRQQHQRPQRTDKDK